MNFQRSFVSSAPIHDLASSDHVGSRSLLNMRDVFAILADGALVTTEATPQLTELSTADLARTEILIFARVYIYFTASTMRSLLSQ